MLSSLYHRLCLLAIIGLFPFHMQGQSCADCRFAGPVFDSVTVETVQFGSGPNADGNQQDLLMDVYQPFGDTATLRPAVIFAFGGGFIQGNRQEGYVVRACERYARAGYVAASIDYRIGIDPLGILDPTAELMRVLFRPMQDMRGALQYVNAHIDSMGNGWRIDSNLIFLGGASAGAITALMVTHCDKDSEFSELGGMSAISGLGGFYSSSGTYSNRSSDNIAGVFNIAGALINANWVEAGDPPILSAHGDQDGTVPIAGGNIDFGIVQLGLEGSQLVHQAALNVGVCSYLFTMVGEDHPSGNAPESYFDQMFHRLMPRQKSTIEGKSFCCPFEVEISPAVDHVTEFQTGQTVHLDALSSNVGPSATYQWCGVPCTYSYSTMGIDLQPDSGDYAIALIADGNCQTTDFTMLDAQNSVSATPDQISVSEPIGIFPNPSSGTVTLDFPGKLSKIDRLIVTDMHGKVLLDRKSVPGPQLELPLSGLASGTYLVGNSKRHQHLPEKISASIVAFGMVLLHFAFFLRNITLQFIP